MKSISRTQKHQKAIMLLIGIIFSLLASTSYSQNVSLKCFIQGYYDVATHSMRPVRMNQACPTPNSPDDVAEVTIELRTALAPYNFITSAPATLKTNGNCSANLAAAPGTYWIIVKSGNAIETWSAAPVSIPMITPYIFSSAANKAYGYNQVEVEPGVFAFYSGDVNQDGIIEILDQIEMNNDIFNNGCILTDLNGDGNGPTLSEFIKLLIAINNFVGVITP